jgi:hypothetical protein
MSDKRPSCRSEGIEVTGKTPVAFYRDDFGQVND